MTTSVIASRRPEGDAGDIAGIFRREAPSLLAYFSRRVQPVEDAADLLSETFVVAWRKVAEIPADPTEVRLWLFGVARKILSQHRRGAVRRTMLADRARTLLRHGAVAGLNGQAHEDEDLSAHVRELIRFLNPTEQEIIALVYWDGFTQEEVARIMGRPSATIRSKLARARSHLREQLIKSDDVI